MCFRRGLVADSVKTLTPLNKTGNNNLNAVSSSCANRSKTEINISDQIDSCTSLSYKLTNLNLNKNLGLY